VTAGEGPIVSSAYRHRARAALLVAIGWTLVVAATPSRPKATRFLDYLQGGRVMRLDLRDLRSTLLFEIPPDAAPARAESIRAGGGSVAWLASRRPAAAMLTWDGQRGGAFPLERWAFGHEGFDLEYGTNDEIVRVIPRYRETVLDGFLVSPDGRRMAWDVNLVAGMTPESTGTIHRRHLVFVSDLDGRNESLVLDERFSVPSIMADADEERHLLFWSRVDPNRLYLTRLHIGQLQSETVGPYAFDLRTRTMDSTRALPGQILALSPDETRFAHTPNDESCCGGLNYTNNLVRVRDVASGRDVVVLDEWKEFGNTEGGVGDVEPNAQEYLPTTAAFSPDGGILAVSLEKWTFKSGFEPELRLTLIRSVSPGDPGRLRRNRVLVGWRDDAQVILGRRAAPDPGTGMLDSLFVYDPVRDRETALPLTRIIPIGIGP
jgi:hypothetical protein